MKREKKSLGTGMPHLLGMLRTVSVTRSASTDSDLNVRTEEANISQVKAEMDRARTWPLQASRLTFA